MKLTCPADLPSATISRHRECKQMIRSGEKIITRAGYSTIMELVSLNSSALLVPTPGQTEQEYLGCLPLRKRMVFFLPSGKI